EGRALHVLEQFCHVSFKHDGRTFTPKLGIVWMVGRWLMFLGTWLSFCQTKLRDIKKKSMIVGAHLIGRIARSYGLMSSSSLRAITLYPGTSLLNTIKLVELGICKYNALGMAELLDNRFDDSEDKAVAAKAKRAQEEAGDVRRHPNLSNDVDELVDPT
ncbi:hypothetical protein Tco_1289372, partial [Tanacetum coccineum]